MGSRHSDIMKVVSLISENEIKAAKELGDAYYIYQVTNALTDPKISTVIKNSAHTHNKMAQ